MYPHSDHLTFIVEMDFPILAWALNSSLSISCYLTVAPYLSLAWPRAAAKPAIMALASSLSATYQGLMALV